MTDIVDVSEAASLLSQVITRVENGGDAIITRHGQPVARLVPFTEQRPVRKPGVWRGRVKIGDDFDAFSEDCARACYGK